ncbi:DNA polymerase III subunit beta [Paenibacillus bouchesdurhonensis]|uniref:DNA polymerase III subunit beta n=1 Tax=Paenibacillus bouchesdurhonensis TaxID=1870990 RepID=UPI000DA602C7|nr:DNA polymerase III subunit beta [Paenibacillus bouchesdurhonensis]
MKLTIQKRALSEAILQVSKAVNNKATIPILTGVKLDVTNQGVTLTASDVETTIQATIPVEPVAIEQSGSVVLPAKFFVEIIKKLPKETVNIEVQDNFATLIQSGRTKLNLVGMDPEEFPAMPASSDELKLTIPGGEIKGLIKEAEFAVSTAEQSPILTGVLWELDNGRLKLTATDRHRLASTVVETGANEEADFRNVVIAAKTLVELSKIVQDKEDVRISVSSGHVLFQTDQVHFFTRMLEGSYPDTSKIIPTSFKSELTVNVKAFNESIDRAYLLAREEKTNIVLLEASEDGAIRIESKSSGVGKVIEQLEADSFSGDPIKIAFNSKYMLDVLKVIGSQQLFIGFTGAMSPIIIRPVDGNENLYLILPYRISI